MEELPKEKPIPSIVWAPIIELKPLTSHLKYAFLEKKEDQRRLICEVDEVENGKVMVFENVGCDPPLTKKLLSMNLEENLNEGVDKHVFVEVWSHKEKPSLVCVKEPPMLVPREDIEPHHSYLLVFTKPKFSSKEPYRDMRSPPAIERLSSGLFQEVIVTNTVPLAEKNFFPQLTVLSTANLLGETIWRVHGESSVSSIFQ
ncbi:hypothetical protein KSS87_012323 [Heliosperma pusillum]|nr:hypothetical protein KSS87_012323 [Heliosperma pusillum]